MKTNKKEIIHFEFPRQFLYSQNESNRKIRKILIKYLSKIPAPPKAYRDISLVIADIDFISKNSMYIEMHSCGVKPLKNIKIGRGLLKIYKDLDRYLRIDNHDYFLDLVSDIQSVLSTDIRFEIVDDVVSIYSNTNGPDTCISTRPHVWRFYNSQPDIHVLVMYENENIVGRALMWTNVEGAKNGIFIDRVYPCDSRRIASLYNKYSLKNDWSYRSTQDAIYADNGNRPVHSSFVQIANSKTQQLKFNVYRPLHAMPVPFMDTFMYSVPSGKYMSNNSSTIKGSNIHITQDVEGVLFDVPNVWNWVDRQNTKSAKYTYYPFKAKLPIVNRFEAKQCTQFMEEKIRPIVWEDGIWKNGTFFKGLWKDGTWENGIFNSGVWEFGTWENGIWCENNGGNIWKNGTWKDGTWNGGSWRNGTWESGIWNKGNWVKGLWKFGIWENGVWENGTWESGEWRDGLWKKGTWKRGIWESGDWLGGKWEGGWIYDPKKKGNYQEDWKFSDGYVESRINPRDYFMSNHKVPPDGPPVNMIDININIDDRPHHQFLQFADVALRYPSLPGSHPPYSLRF